MGKVWLWVGQFSAAEADLKELTAQSCLLTSLPVAAQQVFWRSHYAHILAWVLLKAESKTIANLHYFIKECNPREGEMGRGRGEWGKETMDNQ